MCFYNVYLQLQCGTCMNRKHLWAQFSKYFLNDLYSVNGGGESTPVCLDQISVLL